MPVERGGTRVGGTGPEAGSSLPLPVGTQIGDLIVAARYDGGATGWDFNDARMTLLAGGGGSDYDAVWMGTATTLADLSLTGPTSGGRIAICGTYAPVRTGTPVVTVGSAQPATIPSVSRSSAVAVVTITQPSSSSNIDDYLPYTPTIRGNEQIAAIRIDHWDGLPPSPALTTDVTSAGSGLAWRTVVIPIGAGHTTVRKYPRDVGRIWPPTKEINGLRRAGGYQ